MVRGSRGNIVQSVQLDDDDDDEIYVRYCNNTITLSKKG